MKKGQILEGVIEKVEFPNKGLVYVAEEDQYVLVKNGIPGQKIRFGINKFKHGRAEGRLLEVLERSPLETYSGSHSLDEWKEIVEKELANVTEEK